MLYPLFGTSDVPQAFCRLAAVYGCLYILSDEVQLPPTVEFSPDQVVLATSLGRLQCKRLILASKYARLDPSVVTTVTQQWARAVVISDAVAYESDGPVVITVPPATQDAVPVYILQVTNNTSCVPDGFTIYYLWAKLGDSSLTSMEVAAALLPGTVVLKARYQQTLAVSESALGVAHVRDVCDGVDFDAYFEEAKRVVASIAPGSEFLPTRIQAEASAEDEILKEFED